MSSNFNELIANEIEMDMYFMIKGGANFEDVYGIIENRHGYQIDESYYKTINEVVKDET